MLRPEPLERKHDPSGFDCGHEALNEWLRDHALASHQGEFNKSYVIHERGNDSITGYYTLAAGAVRPEDVPERVGKGGGKHDVPVVVLARLGVDRRIQGNGFGAGLVRDALFRVARAADIIGVRAVLVHMKSPDLRPFYERFDFMPSPIRDDQMFLLMKNLRKSIAAG